MSRRDHKLSMRLEKELRRKLDAWARHFACPMSEVIRQLVRQTTSADFPQSWQQRSEEQQGASHHTRV